MKAVILAGGLGTRMKDLTKDTPKPMLTVAGKNLIEHKIDCLNDSFDEVIIVVGYLKDQIISYFGDNFKGKKITYVEQENLNGTGSALWLCKDILNTKFLVMMGDDLYSKECIEEAIKFDWALVAKEREDSSPIGRVDVDDRGLLVGVVEGDISPTGLVNTGMYVLQPEIFNYPLVKITNREEFGLPQTIVQAVNDFDIQIVICNNWHQMTSPDDLKKAEEKFVKI